VKFNIIFIYITDDYTIAKQKAKASEDTSNISSSIETSEERLTRFQKTKKKVMKNDFKKIEKLIKIINYPNLFDVQDFNDYYLNWMGLENLEMQLIDL